MKKLAIIGTKEFAFQIKEYATRTGEFEVVGFLDDLVQPGIIINGLPVLGKVDDAECLYEKRDFDCIFIAIGYTRFDLREFYFNKLKGKVPFANIISKSVWVGNNVSIGEGIYIGGDSVIDSNTIIEDNVFIHGGTCIGHDNMVGAHTYISGRFNTAGFVKLGKRNFYGICSVISDHVTICDDVWIGLGCIIIKSIKESGKYMVNPKLLKIE